MDKKLSLMSESGRAMVASGGPVYDPVVKNGLFEVTDFVHTKRYRAIDEAEAKYKFCEKFGLPWCTKNIQLLKVTEIEPVIRVTDTL